MRLTFVRPLRLLLVFGGVAMYDLAARAQTQPTTTAPLAAFSKAIAGNSDTIVSLPIVQPPVYAGAVKGVAAATLSCSAGTWTSNAFVYKFSPAQTRTFYVEFTSGNLKGFVYQIIANSDSTLTLDTEGDNLTGVTSIGGAAAGDSFEIHPYWRVSDLFADGNGSPLIDPRPNALTLADELLFPNYLTVGTNKSPNRAVYYVTGQGWAASSVGTTDPGDTVLPPNAAVIVRRRNPAGLTLTTLGAVSMSRSVSFVAGGDGTNGNDVYVALRHPLPVSLNNSGLHSADPSTSVIRDSASSLVRQDELRAIPDGTGFNRSPSIIYFYLANQGWRMVGSSSTTVGDDVLLQPGSAYVVRKKATSAGVDWPKDPNF